MTERERLTQEQINLGIKEVIPLAYTALEMAYTKAWYEGYRAGVEAITEAVQNANDYAKGGKT